MTDAHQDVAGVVDKAVAWDAIAEKNDAIARLIRALSAAEAFAAVSFRCGVAHQERANEMEARAIAAESRLSEAMNVIEPFASRADFYKSDAFDSELVGTPLGHLRAARRFINAGKE
jgi:hypothetical protein